MVATYSVLLARLIVLEDSLEGSFLGVRSVFFHLRFRWVWHRWRAHGSTCPRSTRRGAIPKKTQMSSRYKTQEGGEVAPQTKYIISAKTIPSSAEMIFCHSGNTTQAE